MKIIQVLIELGLNQKDAEIYLTLLKMGGSQPASIIASHLNMNRTTVYKILMNLAKEGLVAKTMKHGILCFFVEHPENHLEDLLIRRKARLDALTKEFSEILPDIKNMQKHELLAPQMRYYEGIEGVKRVYETTLIEGGSIQSFENIDAQTSEIKDYIYNDYIPRRAEQGVFIQVIAPENKEHKDFKKLDKKFNKETRFFPASIPPIEIEINIFANKTAFFSCKKEEMFAVLIDSPTITKSMKSIFELCWKNAK